MKWEYATVEVNRSLVEKYCRLILPGGPTPATPGGMTEAVALLNRMGADGWEVMASSGSESTSVWTLRRPLS